MLVKKFEAPTLREALKDVKNELGPEAIILQTKSKKTGFGLLSGPSVEITAAVSEKQIKTKKSYDKTLSSESLDALYRNPASRQSQIYQNHENKLKNKQEKQYGGAGGYSATSANTSSSISKSFEDLVSSFSKKSPAIDVSSRIAPVIGKSNGYSSGNSPVNTVLNSSQTSESESSWMESNQDSQSFEGRNSIPSPAAGASFSSVNSAQDNSYSRNPVTQNQDNLEIQNIKSIVQELVMDKNFIADFSEYDRNSTVLHEVNQNLLLAGLERKQITRLMGKAFADLENVYNSNFETFMENIAGHMLEEIEIYEHQKRKGRKSSFITAFVGAPGSGKTQMALKLAASSDNATIIFVNPFRKRELFESMKVYSDILGIEVTQVSTVNEYREALKKIPKGTDVIVDTPGVSAQDMGLLMKVNEILSARENSEIFCCLDATSSSFYNNSTLTRLMKMGPDALVFSKLDETPVHGGIYSILSESNLPAVYFGIGTRIPDDFEEASKERIVSLILDI